MAEESQRALVIGASSGIGEAIVRQLAAEGYTVAALARRLPELERLAADCGPRVRPYACDVLAFDEAPALFDQVVKELGGLDLAIYVAGVMPAVEESEYNFEKNRAMIDVNFLGAVRWLDLAGAHFEAQRRGTLCGISSVAGDRGRRGNPVYTASKAGLTAYLEAMRNRLDRYGVRVVTVKPGPVRTAMTGDSKQPFIISAEEAARGALAIVRKGSGEGYVPAIWLPIMLIIRHIPSVLFRRTNI